MNVNKDYISMTTSGPSRWIIYYFSKTDKKTYIEENDRFSFRYLLFRLFEQITVSSRSSFSTLLGSGWHGLIGKIGQTCFFKRAQFLIQLTLTAKKNTFRETGASRKVSELLHLLGLLPEDVEHPGNTADGEYFVP